MGSDNSNLGEQALGKVAEIGITSQLDMVENIGVDVRTDPVKIIQGQVDSVSISGQGLVIKQDLRMESLEINTSNVAINPVSAIFGNIELTHPTDAEAQIVLTEADLNRAFGSDYIRAKLQGLEMQVQGHPVTVDVQQVNLHLPGDNQFVIHADFLLREQGEVKKLSATAIPRIQESGHRIDLEVLSAEGQGLTSELILAIFEQLTYLLDIRNFDIPGMSLQLHQLDVPTGKLLIQARAKIAQIPSA